MLASLSDKVQTDAKMAAERAKRLQDAHARTSGIVDAILQGGSLDDSGL